MEKHDDKNSETAECLDIGPEALERTDSRRRDQVRVHARLHNLTCPGARGGRSPTRASPTRMGLALRPVTEMRASSPTMSRSGPRTSGCREVDAGHEEILS